MEFSYLFVSSQPLQTGNGKGYRIIRESFCKRKVRHNIYSFIMVYSVIYGCIGADHQCDFIFHCDGTYQRHQGYQSFPYRIFPAQPDWWYRTQLYLVNDFNSVLSNFSKTIVSTQWYAFWGMIIVVCWQQIGYMMIIYIAGIQNIPGELIEAAKIDGANSWQLLRYVTLPMLMPTITICTFLTLTNGFKLFDQNFALTGGNPAKMSQLLALNIYDTMYGTTGWQGVGQAKAVIFFILVAVIALIQNKLTTSKEVQD